jgi:Lipopolysaccharide-assembly
MRALAWLALAALVGCGYGLGTKSADIPSTARTISIKPFTNHTREVGLEVRLRRAIEDEFRRRGTLRVVPEGEGDLVLTGEIRRFATVPVAFSATDEAVQYQGVIQVSTRLLERETKRVIHDAGVLQEAQDFGAVTGVVIASSPRFQRGTIDARDLPNLTNVQLVEARRHAALHDLIDVVAHDVYLQTIEGF